MLNMLAGEVKYWKNISNLKNFKEAFKFLENKNIQSLEPKKYIIEGDKIYANIFKTKSRDIRLGKFESHKNYIDIHYLISGKEVIATSNVKNLEVIRDYDREDDSFLYSIPKKYEKLEMEPGNFAIFFPEDAHMPNCHINQQNEDSFF